MRIGSRVLLPLLMIGGAKLASSHSTSTESYGNDDVASAGDDPVAVATSSSTCSDTWEQCGGSGWKGPKCCSNLDDVCHNENQWYSQCIPEEEQDYGGYQGMHHRHHPCSDTWAQCGGKDWTGSKCCSEKNDVCYVQNEWYSQCVPKPPRPSGCSKTWDQCGGKEWTGPKCCSNTGDVCNFQNVWYSQCIPKAPKPPTSSCSQTWGQCGGKHWSGPNCCSSVHDECRFQNEWYSQCIPEYSKPPSKPPTSSCSETWGQCGGQHWTGPRCCSNPKDECHFLDDWHSQCIPKRHPTSSPSVPSESCAGTWGQCGGHDWSGPTCCCHDEDVCHEQNFWYSQCIPTTSTPSTKSPSKHPTNAPTSTTPTQTPTKAPFKLPTKAPTSKVPTEAPSVKMPTKSPGKVPTNVPTWKHPSEAPTATKAPTKKGPSVRAFDVCATSRPGRTIAMTCDDGPLVDHSQTSAVLDMLKKQGVKATFFVLGSDDQSFLEQKCSLLKRMKSEGHYIGAHSWSHIDFTKSALSIDDLYSQQVERVTSWIESCTGQKVTLFRPPFGYLTRSQAEYITSKGLTLAFWNYGTDDWATPNDHDLIWKNFENWMSDYSSRTNSLPRSIVLGMHDDAEYKPPAGRKSFIERVVEKYSGSYAFITAEDCLTECASSNLVDEGICTDHNSPFWGMSNYL